MSVFLTDEIKHFRDMFDGYDQTGVQISGRRVRIIQAKINTLLALASELEEETSCRQWNRLGRPLDEHLTSDKVVLFPGRDDPNGPGDAA